MKLFHVGPDLFSVFMEVKEDVRLAVYSEKLLGDVASVALSWFTTRSSGTDSCGDPVDIERENRNSVIFRLEEMKQIHYFREMCGWVWV